MYGGSSLPNIIVQLKQIFHQAAVDHPPVWEPTGSSPEAAVLGGTSLPAHLGLSCPLADWQEHACLGHPHPDGLPSPLRSPVYPFRHFHFLPPMPLSLEAEPFFRPGQGGVETQPALRLDCLGHNTMPLCASVSSSVRRDNQSGVLTGWLRRPNN